MIFETLSKLVFLPFKTSYFLSSRGSKGAYLRKCLKLKVLLADFQKIWIHSYRGFDEWLFEGIRQYKAFMMRLLRFFCFYLPHNVSHFLSRSIDSFKCSEGRVQINTPFLSLFDNHFFESHWFLLQFVSRLTFFVWSNKASLCVLNPLLLCKRRIKFSSKIWKCWILILLASEMIAYMDKSLRWWVFSCQKGN